jgi:chemotaxis protein CheD
MVCIRETGPVAKIGMAQFRVGTAPMKMVTMALGSCVGIVIYDAARRIGGLAHVMHPSRERVRNNSNRAKFVDTAVELMIARMLKNGANKNRMTAKIFGGARMFEHITGADGIIQIGDANIEAARGELASRGIPVVAERVGGACGRTVLFDLSDGSVRVRDSHDNEEIL